MKNSIRKLILLLFLIPLSCLTSCTKEQKDTNTSDFYKLTSSYFKESVNCDTLTLNYSLSNPAKYEISPLAPTLGTYSIEEIQNALVKNNNYLNKLLEISPTSLSKEDYLTYEVLKDYLELQKLYENYPYYNECIRPSSGIQAQLPILLAEYNFYTEEDIKTYLKLLPCVEKYFDSIITFQQEKSERGLFMSDYLVDQVVAQCESFISNPDSNLLIEYFNKRMDTYPSLSKKKCEAYKLDNETLIKQHVIPAYQKLIDCLNSLKGTGTNPDGLFYFPNGAEYYSLLARQSTGSGHSVKEMAILLDETINTCFAKATFLATSDSSLINKYINFSAFPLTEPTEILSALKEAVKKDFPVLPDVDCSVKYVDDSLSEFLNPAMFLVPAIDSYEDNHIYINGKDAETLSYIYTTVAHEGYPGHLYQCVYYRNQKPNPVRHVMNFLGYDEGWASYVELSSYEYSGIDKNLAEFLATNSLAILCIYARADIGVHYEGWTLDKTKKFLSNYMNDVDTQENIYHTLLNDPGAYLPYAIGCLEFLSLKDTARKKLDDAFDLKAFHTFLLETGPCQFYVLEEHLQHWISSQIVEPCITFYE